MTPFTTISLQEVLVADLDNDGDDELIMFTGGTLRDGVLSKHPEVWIFEGGAGFQVNEPTKILRDSEENGSNGGQFMVAGRWDNDGNLDIVTGSGYATGGNKVKFYFGREGSPWNWTTPDRVVPMSGFIPLDCDGDGMLDIAVGNVVLFLSRGKDIRTRSFKQEDIDRIYYAPYARFVPGRVGYLNDSARHYEMLDIRFNGIDNFLGGGPSGPDGDYEASSGDDATAFIRPAGDINGDGWDDLLGGWPDVNFDAGVAAVFAGGPYIPRDPSLGVRAVAGEGRSNAISIWPNPATTELHIAWRGDLKRMPRRFAIHDLLGRLIAQGEVESWRGEALWQCADAPAGSYILSIIDYRGEMITTIPVIKQ
jgi:hypothetical protein